MPTIGAAGIATANTVAYALQAVLLFVLLNRTLKFGSELGKPVLRALAAAALGGAAAYAVLHWLPMLGGGLVAAIAGGLVGVLVAAIIIREDLKPLAQL